MTGEWRETTCMKVRRLEAWRVRGRNSAFIVSNLLTFKPSNLRKLAAAALLGVLGGCAGPDSYLVSPALQTAPDGRVALLPFENYSNDVSAPGLLREEISKLFARRGYAPQGTAETDEKRRAMGVTDGGQLPAVKPEDIGRALGVDLLCYGSLEDFTFQNLGFVVRKSVRLRLKIVSAGTGETLFEAAGKGRDIKLFLDKDEAAAAFVVYSVQKLAENMLKHPLRAESEKAMGQVFERLPQR